MSNEFLKEMRKKQIEKDRLKKVNLNNSKNVSAFLNQTDAIKVMFSLISDKIVMENNKEYFHVELKEYSISNFIKHNSIYNNKFFGFPEIRSKYFSFKRKINNRLEIKIGFRVSEKIMEYIYKNKYLQIEKLPSSRFIFEYLVITNNSYSFIRSEDFGEFSMLLLEEILEEEENVV